MEELSIDEPCRNHDRRKKIVCLIIFLATFLIVVAFTAFNSWRSIKGHIQIKVNTEKKI